MTNKSHSMAQKLASLLLLLSTADALAKQVTDYTNKCMNEGGIVYYKPKPGPEPNLECKQYREKSCCKPGALQPFEYSETWNSVFNFNHCPQKKARLSPECHKRVMEEGCFNLCDPNMGPWMTTMRNDTDVLTRARNVPICQSSCSTWWDACRKEYTCTDNWLRDLYVVDGGLPACSSTMPCKTYEEYFKNSTHFCESIWDNWYKVYPDNQPCMKFVFDASKGNPNEAIALAKARALVQGGK